MKKLPAVLLGIATTLAACGADSQPIYFTIPPPVLPPGDMFTITANVIPPPGMRVVGIRLVLEPVTERHRQVPLQLGSQRLEGEAASFAETAHKAEMVKPKTPELKLSTNAVPVVNPCPSETKLVVSPMTTDQLAERRAIIGFTLQRKRK